jgi:7-carboxy-7-deazaguanine synthase
MSKYPVNDIYPCIQGEGVQTGIPMILLRLQGCAVGCPWCDTKQTWTLDAATEVPALDEALGANARHAYLTASEINHHCRVSFPTFQWVLVTGGEPAQYDLRALVVALHDGGYRVALETSGTELGHLDAGFDWTCVSPKINMPGGKPVLPEALAVADEIKMVIGRPRDIERLDRLLTVCQLKKEVQLCLQPVSQSPRATDLCVQMVQARGWRLSLQTHKYLGQP